MDRPVVLILLVVAIVAAIALICCGCCACGALILATTSTPVARAPEVPRATVPPELTVPPRPTSTPRPTNTPRPTATSRPTSTPRPTPTATSLPTYTSVPTVAPTPAVSYVYMEDDGKGNRRCNPDTVPAGRIVIERGIGRWPTQEEAYAAVGDTWPPIVANGRELPTKHLERSKVQWHTSGPDDPSPGWGFHAKVEIWLDPGVYEITSLWLHDLKTGTLTVTTP